MGIITWIVVGLVAGLIARAIVPGRQAMGLVATTILGIVGSLLGGLIGSLFLGDGAGVGKFTPGGLVLSIVGAVVLLFAFSFIRRPARTPP